MLTPLLAADIVMSYWHYKPPDEVIIGSDAVPAAADTAAAAAVTAAAADITPSADNAVAGGSAISAAVASDDIKRSVNIETAGGSSAAGSGIVSYAAVAATTIASGWNFRYNDYDHDSMSMTRRLYMSFICVDC